MLQSRPENVFIDVIGNMDSELVRAAAQRELIRLQSSSYSVLWEKPLPHGLDLLWGGGRASNPRMKAA